MSPEPPDNNRRPRIPDHVVRRAFPGETVILNLETGQYHGLNPTAGRMLGALEASDSIGGAVAALAREFGISYDEVNRDLLELCEALSDRGLLELDEARPA
jgi:hypothetical protein